jgi:hypothetical protein
MILIEFLISIRSRRSHAGSSRSSGYGIDRIVDDRGSRTNTECSHFFHPDAENNRASLSTITFNKNCKMNLFFATLLVLSTIASFSWTDGKGEEYFAGENLCTHVVYSICLTCRLWLACTCLVGKLCPPKLLLTHFEFLSYH